MLKKRQTNRPASTLKNEQAQNDVPLAPDAVKTDNNGSIDAQANKNATEHKMFLDETVKS